MNCQPLYEAYRPKTWSEVIGQPKAIAKLDRFRKRRGTLAGDCYFLSGSSGTGKTSIALLIADEVADRAAGEHRDVGVALGAGEVAPGAPQVAADAEGPHY